jgi:hypothetical protein
MLIAVRAIMPSVFMVIAVVIAIIIAFAWPNKATYDEAEQSQQESALRKTLRIYHW